MALNGLLLLLALFARTDSLCADPGVTISGMRVQGQKNVLIDLDTNGFSLPFSQENISLFLNGAPAESFKIISNDTEIKNVLYLIVSIDSSRSISEKLLLKIKKKAKEIVRENIGNELISLYQFNDEVLQLNAFSKHKPDIEKSIDSISRQGSKTLLYNSLFDCVDLLQKTHGEVKSLIVFTDGVDEGSKVTAEDVISLAKEAGIKVSFVSVQKNSSALGFQRKMAMDTGGVLLSIDDADAGSALNRLYSKGFSRKYTLSADMGDLGSSKVISADVRIKAGDRRYRIVQSLPIPQKSAYDYRSILMTGLLSIFVLFLFCFMLFKYGHFLLLKKDKNPSIRVMRSAEKEKDTGLSIADNAEDAAVTNFENLAWLYRKYGQGNKEKFSVHSCGLTLGRSKRCGLIIEDPEVSLSHAQIRKEKGTYYLFDLVSEFGVFLNGKKILRPRVLHDWDEIQIGETFFVFREPKE